MYSKMSTKALDSSLRNALGVKYSEDQKESIQKLMDIFETNNKMTDRITFFEKNLKELFKSLMKKEYGLDYVSIYDDSFTVDRYPRRFNTEEIREIEKITGYKFKETSWGGRYIFERAPLTFDKDEESDLYKNLRETYDYILGEGDYVSD